jgi:hypothetical protein
MACMLKCGYLPPEHDGELLGDALEDLLDGGGVAHEGGGHLEPARRHVAHRHLHVVRDPLHEVAAHAQVSQLPFNLSLYLVLNCI